MCLFHCSLESNLLWNATLLWVPCCHSFRSTGAHCMDASRLNVSPWAAPALQHCKLVASNQSHRTRCPLSSYFTSAIGIISANCCLLSLYECLNVRREAKPVYKTEQEGNSDSDGDDGLSSHGISHSSHSRQHSEELHRKSGYLLFQTNKDTKEWRNYYCVLNSAQCVVPCSSSFTHA